MGSNRAYHILRARKTIEGFRQLRDFMDLYDEGTETACDVCPCKECCDYITEFERVRKLRKEADCDDMWRVWKAVKGEEGAKED